MSVFSDFIKLLLVGFLWGVTNPLIKKTTKDFDSNSDDGHESKIVKISKQFVKILKNWPFLLNQCGSVIYFLTLQSCPVSLAVPVSNSVTFITTGLTSIWLGEEKPDIRTVIGVIFVIVGITLCVFDKLE